MEKSEFRKIQKILALALQEAEKEAIAEGIDIRDENYDKVFSILREKILNELGLTLEKYEELRKSFKIPKKPISYKELVDTPDMPVIPETLTPEAVRVLIKEVKDSIPKPTNITINKIEKIIEKPQIIKTIEKTKEIVQKLDTTQLNELKKDIRHLQETFQGFKIPEPIDIDKLKKALLKDSADHITGLWGTMPDFRAMAMGLRGDIDKLQNSVSDIAYAASWDGVTDVAPSKNAVYDAFVPYTGATANVNLGVYSLTTPLILGGTATSSDLTLQTTSGVGATGADMHFKVGNNGATEAMTILNSGYVGIGTTGPGAKLHISETSSSGEGSVSALIIQHESTNDNWSKGIHATDIAHITETGYYTANSFAFSISPSVALGITNSGYVSSLYASTLANTGLAGTLARMYGLRIEIGHTLEVSTGITNNIYGLDITPIRRRGTIDNFYVLSIPPSIGTGTVTNPYALYDRSGWNWWFASDNQKLLLGAGADASFYYDGTNTVINPKEVGSGYLDVLGKVNADNFVSDIAIGTQPYACTSTTLNTNLNADLLDSQEGIYYLAWANFTGIPTTLSGYGISDTMANFDTALSDGNFAYAGGAFHDGFSDFVVNEHIDWTSTTANLLTTGTLGAGAITGTSFIIGANTLDTTEWAFLDGQDQAVKIASSPTFANIDITAIIKYENAFTFTLLANNSSVSVTFPTAFGAGVTPVVVATPPYQTSFWVTSITNTGFVFNVGTTNAYNQTINYIAMEES